MNIPRHSAGLRLLKMVRDEAHRFGVQYNRTIRKGRTIRSELDSIRGIGPARRTALLKKFGSTAAILRASDDELLAVRGMTTTLISTIRTALGGSVQS